MDVAVEKNLAYEFKEMYQNKYSELDMEIDT